MSEKKDLHPAVHAFLKECGKKGGSVKSLKKRNAVRQNAKKGGWPRGRSRKKKEEV